DVDSAGFDLGERLAQLWPRDSDHKRRQSKPNQGAQNPSSTAGAAFPDRAKWRGRGKYNRSAWSEPSAQPCQQGNEQQQQQQPRARESERLTAQPITRGQVRLLSRIGALHPA